MLDDNKRKENVNTEKARTSKKTSTNQMKNNIFHLIPRGVDVKNVKAKGLLM